MPFKQMPKTDGAVAPEGKGASTGKLSFAVISEEASRKVFVNRRRRVPTIAIELPPGKSLPRKMVLKPLLQKGVTSCTLVLYLREPDEAQLQQLDRELDAVRAELKPEFRWRTYVVIRKDPPAETYQRPVIKKLRPMTTLGASRRRLEKLGAGRLDDSALTGLADDWRERARH